MSLGVANGSLDYNFITMQGGDLHLHVGVLFSISVSRRYPLRASAVQHSVRAFVRYDIFPGGVEYRVFLDY